MNQYIKKLSYYAPIIRMVRFLGLTHFARDLYYHFAKPVGGILDVEIEGIRTKYYVKNSDELRLAESVSGEWGERQVITQMLKKIRSTDCILDVGANIGMYTLLFAKSVNRGEVIAFEPEEKSFLRLQENIKLNSMTNIKVFQKALGSSNNMGKLSIGGIAGNFSLAHDNNAENHQQVQIVNGDEFFPANGLPVPQVVKIDVEGYEYSVLQGLKNTLSDMRCKILCCEIHPGFFSDGITEEMILNFIKSLGFTDISFFRKTFFKPYHIIAQKSENYKK